LVLASLAYIVAAMRYEPALLRPLLVPRSSQWCAECALL